jgi:REP element-mobilizing transposase RayT
MSQQPKSIASADAVEGAVQPRFGEVLIRTRGRLPHWEKESGLYFLTFRLADSLPQHVLDRIVERNRILLAAKRCGASLLPEQKVRMSEYSVRKIEEYSDRGTGGCILRHPPIAAAMADALRYGHGKRYRLLAWCIMPNHVHVVCRMFPGFNLGEVVKSWKGYSARAANRILCRTGTVWQREYYDRLIRKEGEFDRAVEYVLSNPERAGLRNWPWVWSAGEDTRTTAGRETGATAL